MAEAAAAVHRKFGRSKRFSERDKKQIAELIATNMQAAMESWKTKVKDLQKQLDETSDTMHKIDTVVGTINDKLGHFLKRYQTPLSDILYDV